MSDIDNIRTRAHDLYARYAECLDDGDGEVWPTLFTENGRYRVATRENHDAGLPLSLIYCDGRGMMMDRIAAMRSANIYEPHTYCHMTSGLRLTEHNGRAFKARCNFTVLRTIAERETTIFAAGRCFDTIERVGEELLFRERLIVLDSRQIDTLLVLPL